MSSRIITLTSDFGSGDEYVAAMKGVILGICPDATLIDISHDIPAHDVANAAFVLGGACCYYPTGTVHVAVVDPGVGTARNPIMMVTPTGVYLAPDNGVLTYILLRNGASVGSAAGRSRPGDAFMEPVRISVPESCKAHALDREEYWLKPVSNTFHGRDIFSPAAAHFSAGVSPGELGTPIHNVTCLNVPMPEEAGGIILGHVIHIDRFGNLISNIRPRNAVERGVEVEVKERLIPGLSSSYASSEGLLAIIGGRGYLEIAVKEGSAAQHLGATVGTPVKVDLGQRATRP